MFICDTEEGTNSKKNLFDKNTIYNVNKLILEVDKDSNLESKTNPDSLCLLNGVKTINSNTIELMTDFRNNNPGLMKYMDNNDNLVVKCGKREYIYKKRISFIIFNITLNKIIIEKADAIKEALEKDSKLEEGKDTKVGFIKANKYIDEDELEPSNRCIKKYLNINIKLPDNLPFVIVNNTKYFIIKMNERKLKDLKSCEFTSFNKLKQTILNKESKTIVTEIFPLVKKLAKRIDI